MTAQVSEQTVGGMRWIVARGSRSAVFRKLGVHMQEEIRQVVDRLPAMRRLAEYVRTAEGAERFRSVQQASQSAFAVEWQELEQLATGAGAPVETLALLNMRGDLGDMSPGVTGCSDLCWRRRRAYLAHNEDGSQIFEPLWAMLTLQIEGDPTCTAFWYPGFLPANAFTLTETGLVWTVDHMPTPQPIAAPGRHFLARNLQRHGTTTDAAVDHLTGGMSAGAFAYNFGDASGRVVTAEVGAGHVAVVETTPKRPLTWHTNHGRYIDGAPPSPHGTSQARADILQTVAPASDEPDENWLLQHLCSAPPDGVHANGASVTLVTCVADLLAGSVTFKPRGRDRLTLVGDQRFGLHLEKR